MGSVAPVAQLPSSPDEVLHIHRLRHSGKLEVSEVRRAIEASNSWSDSVLLEGLSTGAWRP